MDEPRCFVCGKLPEEIREYDMFLDPGQTASEYIREEEGTYNPNNNRFACTECYIKIGQPSSPTGWKAP